MCALGMIYNDLKVVFCFMHATTSHYHHDADLLIALKSYCSVEGY